MVVLPVSRQEDCIKRGLRLSGNCHHAEGKEKANEQGQEGDNSDIQKGTSQTVMRARSTLLMSRVEAAASCVEEQQLQGCLDAQNNQPNGCIALSPRTQVLGLDARLEQQALQAKGVPLGPLCLEVCEHRTNSEHQKISSFSSLHVSAVPSLSTNAREGMDLDCDTG